MANHNDKARKIKTNCRGRKLKQTELRTVNSQMVKCPGKENPPTTVAHLYGIHSIQRKTREEITSVASGLQEEVAPASIINIFDGNKNDSAYMLRNS